MLRRFLILCSLPVLAVASVAFAGQSSLATQLLTAANITFSGSVPLDTLRYDDPAGDIYHPAGEPGLLDGMIDIRSIEMSAWAIDIAKILDGPNPFEAIANSDEIKRGGPVAFGFAIGAPYVVAELEVAAEFRYEDARFCEFPLAWNTPGYPTFEGIAGDLFNGTNYVTVARMGAGVPDGFEVRSLEFLDGSWQEMDPFGFAAASGNRLVYAIPAERFGSAGDGMRLAFGSFLRGGQSTDTVVDFNFGAFCSEGGRSFDPSLGGVDILQEPIDLAGLPVTIVGAPEEGPTPTTEAPPATATPTTLDDTPVTSVAPGEEEPAGGISPLLVALIVGGMGAAAIAATRMRRDDRTPPGLAVRLTIDGGPSGSFSGVTGLDLDPAPIEYRDGSEPVHVKKQPGIGKYALITLKSGTIDDPSWILDGIQREQRSGGSITVEPQAGPAISWKFERGWPGKWSGPGHKATGNEVAFESLELHVEGLQISPGR